MTRSAIGDDRAFLAAIVESSSDAIVGKDLDGVIRSWNRAAEQMFGYTAEEAVGQYIGLIIPPDRADEEALILGRIRRGERVEHFETIRRAKDGRELTISLTVSPIRDESGVVVGASKIARDITAQREAERLLKESEERFRTLADNISQLAWMADETGSIFWYNRRWFEYSGTTFEETAGSGWTKIQHPDHVERVVESYRAAIRAGEVWEDTFPLRARGGSYRWFLSRASPIRDETGRIVRWFGTNTDITDRMQMEEALRNSNRRKDQFLATLAHELRNPLAPIQTGIDLLRMADGDFTETQRVLDTLERQTAHLVRLVDDLLDVSRITRGKVELRREEVELGAVVSGTVDAQRPLVEGAGHRLEVDVPPGITLVADRTRLAQVITNLLSNAVKYTREPGRITIGARVDAGEVEIAVADTGIGLAPEVLDRIFEPFFQVSAAGTGGSAGLGIGLTLVASLVSLHGGTIRAESEGVGRGSRFVVRLPIGDRGRRVAGGEPTGAPRRADRPRRVLVVDDNRDAADALGTLLEQLGHEVRVLYDGADVVQAGSELRPDVVLLDLGMAAPDGFTVATQLRAEPWGRAATLVALTGWGQERDRERTRRAGFDHHVVKPVRRAELERLLDELPDG